MMYLFHSQPVKAVFGRLCRHLPSLILPSMLMTGGCAAQQFHAGLLLGGGNYQGELRASSFNFRGLQFLAGLGVFYSMNNRIILSAEVMTSNLKGSDDQNLDGRNAARNLSFRSRLHEAALMSRINLLGGWTLPTVPYLIGGIGAFYVNPYTYDAGNAKTYLFPLSTEGQGIPGYEAVPVQRNINICLPYGAGVQVQLTQNAALDIEFLFRKTLTDYIDDVSGRYPDEIDLYIYRGSQARDLSYRGWELAGGNPNFPARGGQRGNPDKMDAYHAFNVRYKVALNRRSDFIGLMKEKARTDCWDERKAKKIRNKKTLF